MQKKQQNRNAERKESQISAVGFVQMENEITKAKEEIQVMSLKLQYIKIYSSLKPSSLYCMYYPTSNYEKKIHLVNDNGDK